jgi:hypothetical protein
MLGIDVRGLDVPVFLAAARALFPLLALAGLAALLRLKRPGWLLAGVAAANAYAWAVTNYPLSRVYAFDVGSDRLNSLALVQVVASGHSPVYTSQVGQLHFEPFWCVLVAALSGWSTDRVLALYPYLPLATMIGFALALYFGLRRQPDAREEAWSGWERALVAGFATLLCSSPLDFEGPYRVPWASTFLLKPNHALGLVLFPFLLAAFARIKGWKGRLGVGLLLHLLGWAFVLHMAYVCVGLVVFAVWSFLARRPDARRDALDVAVTIGINALVVSPYLVLLILGYPFLARDPIYTIPETSPHLLEPTLAAGVVFVLGVWGAAVAYRRGDRLGRLWAAQVVGGFLVWAGYLGLSALQLAREKDEIFFWCRFLTAGSAGIGAWDLARRAIPWLGDRWRGEPVRAAAIAALALPFALPAWWDPLRMDPYFAGSVPPVSPVVAEAAAFLKNETPTGAVLAGDLYTVRIASALTGRRTMMSAKLGRPKDWPTRERALRTLAQEDDSRVALSAAALYGVEYLVVTPEFLRERGLTLADLDGRRHLKRVHLAGTPPGPFIAVYRLVPVEARGAGLLGSSASGGACGS